MAPTTTASGAIVAGFGRNTSRDQRSPRSRPSAPNGSSSRGNFERGINSQDKWPQNFEMEVRRESDRGKLIVTADCH